MKNFNNTRSIEHGVNEIFRALFENRPSKFISIMFAILATIINTLMLNGIIWYGQVCSKRTLLNKLITGMSLSLIATMLICLSDILRYSIGPMSAEFCFFQVVAKNMIKTLVLLFFDAIILVSQLHKPNFIAAVPKTE